MTNKDLFRAGLVAAILSALSWFAFVYGQLNLAIPETNDAQQWFRAFEEGGLFIRLYGWGGTLGTLLTIPYLLAFYLVIKEKAPLVAMPMIYAVVGTALTVLGFFKPLTALHGYLPIASTADAHTLPLLKTAAEVAIELYELPWNIGSFLLFGTGIGLIAYYAWRTKTGPAWLNWVGIIGGIAGITWLAPYIPWPGDTLRLLTIVVNILGIIIWSVGLSIVLYRQNSQAPA